MVEEFDVIDVVFTAVEGRIYEKYVKLFKGMAEESFRVEWSLDNPYAKAEKTGRGLRITKTLSMGGFILRTPSKTLIVMFPSAIMARNDVDDEDINRVRCALNHDFYHELIHYLASDLSEEWVSSATYVLCMEDCINLDCKHLVGGSIGCDLSFVLYEEMEDPDEIPLIWDEEWEQYYEKIRRRFKEKIGIA